MNTNNLTPDEQPTHGHEQTMKDGIKINGDIIHHGAVVDHRRGSSCSRDVTGSATADINAKCCETCASWNAKADGFCAKHGFPTEAKEYCIEHKQNAEVGHGEAVDPH